MTQAILAKDIRGELVPTEAGPSVQEGRDYDPASALLNPIRAAREASPAPTRSKRAKPASSQPATKATSAAKRRL